VAVVAAGSAREEVVNRARGWHHAEQRTVCDVLTPWAQGTILRATRYPNYFAYNLVRVERDPRMSVEELVSFADEALAGFAHRRIDVEDIAAAESLRAGLEASGWKTMRVLWMRHQAPPPPGPELPVEEVSYDAVNGLRVAWHQEEDSSEQDAAEYHQQARDVALRRGVQVLTVRSAGEPVAFAQLARNGLQAEITEVYVEPQHRGAGLGSALTRAAIAAAGEVEDLWICADDEGRPKELYARLDFRPVWTTMEFTLRP
jgi:ribosomal protein S18 acetylase RimI-like enzyme